MKSPIFTTILFDYGATLDTDGTHWYHIFAAEYQRRVPAVADEVLRRAYVHAERSIAAVQGVHRTDTFLEVLHCKVQYQCAYLATLSGLEALPQQADAIADACYHTARQHATQAATVLQQLTKAGLQLGLVSNFYGNLPAVLADFGLQSYFRTVVESATEQLRKPDPRLWQIALERLQATPEQTLVVGDSYAKDIVPAHAIGCHTAWLQGQGWETPPVDTSAADHIIHHLQDLTSLL